jgi:peptidoglycan hydrolase-like protein with peptidoglycan-binding domain
MSYQKDGSTPAREIGGVRVAPTEDFVKSGRAFVESTMSGEIVRKIQQALISQGFLKITKPTNYFGSKTDAAVRAFQKAKGLKDDGKVGKSTYDALFAASATTEKERQFPEEITNIQPKGLANLTKGIQTPPQITRQGNIQTANY